MNPPPATSPLSTQDSALRTLPERTLTLGHSVQSRPITLHLFGHAPNPTLILAAIHGNEPTSHTVAERLLDHLRQNPDALARNTSVAILPIANPDGLALKTRTNAHKIDLNRNFPANNWTQRRTRTNYFGGQSHSSEPETLALLAAFDQLRPSRVISIHSMDAPCNNYDGPALELANQLARHNNYPVKDNIGYPTPGSLGAYAGIDRQIPTVTLELPRKADDDTAWSQNRAALLSILQSQ
jgi:predicted deacylase